MKKWWWIIIGSIVLICGVVYAYKEISFYKEKAAITDKQKEIVEELEKADLEHIKSEESLIRQLAEKKKQLAQKDMEITNLETQLHNIIIPSTPDDLVNAWGKVGIRASRRSPTK